ncbi:MAG: restriction endonuclease PLD domain-containing protein [bacterium]
MELILSNIPPVRFGGKNAFSCFEELLHDADGLRIASGYISADALVELKNIFESNKKSFMELVIGMHGFDGFTRSQYEAAKYLDDFLRSKNAGEVKIATVFRFHGKMYSFLKNKSPFAGIVGSSNLTSIFDNMNAYEADILIDEQPLVTKINGFITRLSEQACTSFNKWEVKKFIETDNIKLDGYGSVEKISKEKLDEVFSKRSAVSFSIPIKGDEAPQSNLNVSFGKGRENKKGFVKPRSWYEVELIVPNIITNDVHYPKAGYPDTVSIITVYTDDGWKFKCKISGDYSKNFRSTDDLKILGRWIKGRMENAGVLKTGEPVTDQVLAKYGRNNFELIGTNDPVVWLLIFGV